MEKASNNNNNSTKLSKMLPKALSIGHSAASFSPARDYYHNQRTTWTARRGFFFSSPITPLIPASARARRRAKNDVGFAEPTSPKVSCIGQIKHGKPKYPEKNNRAATKNLAKEEGSFTILKRLFSTRKSNSTVSSAAAVEAPSLGQMKKFASTRESLTAVEAPSLGKMKILASSREALGGFDWTARANYADVTISCLPLPQTESLSVSPKPKNEVNLWQRRTIHPPKPLQLKPTF